VYTYLPHKLWEFLKEDFFYTPAFHVSMVALEERREFVCVCDRVVRVCFVEPEWPAKFEVFSIIDGEVTAGREIIAVIFYKTVT